jgi:hypothetical protein
MSLVLNALSLQAQAVTYSWVKTTRTAAELAAGFDDICAGIDTNPQSWTAFNSVAVGPCTSQDGPPVFIEQDLHDIIYVSSADDYLTTDANLQEALPTAAANSNAWIYRDYNGTAEQYGGKYAYIQTGGFYGTDPATSGAYVGTANFLVVDGPVSTNVNDFYLSGDPTSAPITRGESPYGAPLGPYTACISPLNNNGACGDARTAPEGYFKFSIFGYTTGSAYVSPQVNGAAAGAVGMRMELRLKNKDGTTPSVLSLSFNNDPSLTLANVGHTNVESFTLVTGDDVTTYTFPTTYNVGTTPVAGVMTVPTPTATKTVAIRVSAIAGETNAIYVDFLFEASDFNVANNK